MLPGTASGIRTAVPTPNEPNAITEYCRDMSDSDFGRQDGQAHLSAIAVKQHPTTIAMTIGATFIILGIVSFLVLGNYTRRVTAVGLLAPSTGIVRVRAASPGHVSQIFVKEGQVVRKGDPLFALEDGRGVASDPSSSHASETMRLTDALADSMNRRGEALTLERDSRRVVTQEDLVSLEAQLKQGKDELASAQHLAQLAQQRAAEARIHATSFDDLAKKGFYSNASLHDKHDLVASLELAAADAFRNVQTLKRQLTTLATSRSQIIAKTNLDLAQIDQRRAALQQDTLELNNRKSSLLVAPVKGRVTGVLVDIGTYVEGQVTATVVPDNVELQAYLYLPSRAVGFVRRGQAVKLRYDAFPYQKFGAQDGVVTDVSLAQIAQEQIPESLPLQSREGLYRVTVRLASQTIRAFEEQKALFPGMVAEADLMQENRTLLEWILEPLIAAKERLSTSPLRSDK